MVTRSIQDVVTLTQVCILHFADMYTIEVGEIWSMVCKKFEVYKLTFFHLG